MAIKLWDLTGAEDDRRFSPYCWRVKMALAHKGLQFESLAWRFTDKDAIAFSGQKLVPVIVDGSRIVSDSWAIAVYLDEAYADRPQLFSGEEGRTLSFFIKNWVERIVHPAVLRAILPDLFAHLHEKDRSYFRETREKRFGMALEAYAGELNQALSALRAAVDPVRPVLVESRFLSGRTPGFADYILFGAFQWARAVSPVRLLEPDDALFGWRERMLDLHDGIARDANGYPV